MLKHFITSACELFKVSWIVFVGRNLSLSLQKDLFPGPNVISSRCQGTNRKEEIR